MSPESGKSGGFGWSGEFGARTCTPHSWPCLTVPRAWAEKSRKSSVALIRHTVSRNVFGIFGEAL